MDPYAILQIEKNATPDQISKAYRAIAKVYHPDKGGNAEMFRILTEAYQTIINQIGGSTSAGNRGYTSNGRGSYTREDPEVPNRGNLSAREYSMDRFNQNFRENQRGGEVDFVYGVDDTDFQPRNLADYKRQRDSVREDLDNMKPLFNQGMGFNQNVFNQMFEKLKKQNGEEETSMIPYSEPRAMVSQNQIGFSNLNPHSGLVSRHDISTSDLTKNYCDLNQELNIGGGVGPGASFNHPDTLSRRDYRDLRDRPDITKVNKLTQKDIKKRVGTYHDSKIQIPKGGPKPPSGDLDYNFDPFYQQKEQQTSRRIEYQPQHNNNHRQDNHRDHRQDNHPNQDNHHNRHQNNRHHHHQNNHYHQNNHHHQNNRHQRQPITTPQQQMVSYTHNSGGDLGKPFTPQITYYRTETTSEYVVPPQQNRNSYHQPHHSNPPQSNQLNPPQLNQQMPQPNHQNYMNRENRIDGRLDDFSHMSYGSSHQNNTVMPYPSSSGTDQSNQQPMRTQFGDQGTNKMKEMEAELSKMKRTVRIQDKLIRKIKKKGMM